MTDRADPEKEARVAWIEGAIRAIGDAAFRDAMTDHVPGLDETTWVVRTLTDDAIDRVATFLEDLSKRAPLATGAAWDGHRVLLEAIAADLRREHVRREA